MATRFKISLIFFNHILFDFKLFLFIIIIIISCKGIHNQNFSIGKGIHICLLN